MGIAEIANGVAIAADVMTIVMPFIGEWSKNRKMAKDEKMAAAEFCEIVSNLGVGQRQLLCNAYHNEDKFYTYPGNSDLKELESLGLVQCGAVGMFEVEFSLKPITLALVHNKQLNWFSESEHKKAQDIVAKRKVEEAENANYEPQPSGEWYE